MDSLSFTAGRKKTGRQAVFWCGAALLLGWGMVTESETVSQGVLESVRRCLTILVPSLFGFLTLSAFFIRSQLYLALGKPFSLLSRYVFRLPPDQFPIFLISLFAGYPVGAKLLSEMEGQGRISRKDAESLLGICYSSGPSFVIGLVGVQVFSSVRIGTLLFFSLLLANLAIAIARGFFRPVPPKDSEKPKWNISAAVLVQSVESGAKSMYLVCIMVVFFGILLSLLERSGALSVLSGWLSPLFQGQDTLVYIKSLLEISSLSALPQDSFQSLPAAAALLSFGGVCVVLQIAALTGGRLRLGKFLLARALSMPIAWGICRIMTSCFAAEVSAIAARPFLAFRECSPLPSICLLFMTAILLCSGQKETGREI